MSIKKTFLKTKSICKVAFKVSASEANGAKTIQILGDFNDWDQTVEPMKALKSGDFTQIIELESGKEYQMRYFIDGNSWANDVEADLQLDNEFGEKNDVISTFN
ncbi:MAG: isoamylase early set domain-containing protein [Prolixibacteraceae bacterium]